MSVMRPLVISMVLYALVLAQASFMPHFAILGQVPNLAFLFFFILIFFEEDYVFWYAAFTGVLLDLFFFPFIGISVVTLYGVWGFQKLHAHFFDKNNQQSSVVAFGFSFLTSFALYAVVMYAFAPYHIGWNVVISFAYNLLGALAGLYIFRRMHVAKEDRNQLKLF